MDFRTVTFKQFLTLNEAKINDYTTRAEPDGTVVKVYKPSGPRQGSRAHARANIRGHGSRHIGGFGERSRSRASGVRAANTQGVPVIGQGKSNVSEELKHLNPAAVAVRNKPNLIDREHPNHPDSYEYRQKWRGKPKSKAGREGHEVAHDVAKNHERLGKAKASDKSMPTLKNYLPSRPPREGNRN